MPTTAKEFNAINGSCDSGGGKRAKLVDDSISNSEGPTNGRSTIQHGFDKTGSKLRSILMHPIGLPLTSLLNDHGPLHKVPAKFWNGLSNTEKFVSYTRYSHECICCVGRNRNSKRTPNHKCNHRDYVFAAAVLKWDTLYETHLTSRLFSYISELIRDGKICGFKNDNGANNQPKSLLVIEKEKNVKNGRLDFVISKEIPETHEKSVVAIIEFGVCCESWWKKQDQILQYVNKLLTEKGQKFVIDQPFLVIVITVNERQDSGENDIENVAEEDYTCDTAQLLQDYYTQMETIDVDLARSSIKTRYGVFLCMPKGLYDYRLALLWRHESTTLLDATQQFGKLLYAAQICVQLRERFAADNNMKMYKYLGPNCCKIDNMLFRSYDNRLRATERRPDLYDAFLEGNADSNTVLQLYDAMDNTLPLQFGQKLTLPTTGGYFEIELFKRNWLWKFKGQLRIITTAFYKGEHFATSMRHFLPIIEHLEGIHALGFVHGDIRAYNMVMNHENNTGCLIDFDYGTKKLESEENEWKYPVGYEETLKDGTRIGEAGGIITYDHDWFALGSVMLDCHNLSFRCDGTDNDELISFSLRGAKFLRSIGDFSSLEDNPKNSLSQVVNLVKFLKDYIHLAEAHKVPVVPSLIFGKSLRHCQEIETEQVINSNKKATGCPPNKLQ